MSEHPHIHPDDAARLKVLKERIDELEAQHVEEVRDEKDMEMHEKQKNVTNALQRLRSVEREAQNGSQAPPAQEFESVKEEVRRLSGDYEVSKMAVDAAKSDLQLLVRLRRDEQQLLNAIFSQVEWRNNPDVNLYEQEIEALDQNTRNVQTRIGGLWEIKGLLDVVGRKLEQAGSGLRSTMMMNHEDGLVMSIKDIGSLQKADDLISESAGYMIKAKRLIPELPITADEDMVDVASCGLFGPLLGQKDQDIINLGKSQLQKLTMMREQVIDAENELKRMININQAEKNDVERKKSSKQNEFLDFQRRMVLTQ